MSKSVLAVLLAALAFPAMAETQSEVVFSAKAWEVRVVGFDDGTFSCLAQVTDSDRSFTLWADASENVQLQFFDSSWDLGQDQTADLKVQIDRRSPWSLNAADLHEQSVFFGMPDSDEGVRFMTEVMEGNAMTLSNDSGEAVATYSLAGSNASIQALIQCVNVLQKGSNPFK